MVCVGTFGKGEQALDMVGSGLCECNIYTEEKRGDKERLEETRLLTFFPVCLV